MMDKHEDNFYDYWAKMPEWKLDEAVCLFTEMNPDVFKKYDFVRAIDSDGKYQKIHRDLHYLAKRYVEKGFLKSKAPPAEYISWADDIKIPVPEELRNLVSAFSKNTICNSQVASDFSYIPPYMDFMLKAVKALNLESSERVPVKEISAWLEKNWPDNLDGKSSKLIQYMTTLMRRPSDKKGGNTKYKNDK